MKKILLSLSMIAIVGVLSIGATGAFFSDTETSTGNTFTAGTIDLKIDSEQHYNGNVCTFFEAQATTSNNGVAGYLWSGPSSYPAPGTPCTGTWEQTDLGIEHKFFNYNDIKPGDEGENTISIHIDSNPAWMCVDIAVTKNDDVTCTEPEDGAEGVGVCQNSVPSADFDGDLAQNINFFSWLDDGETDGFQGTTTDAFEGDNIWQEGEVALFSNTVGPLSDAIGGKTYALADSTTGFGPVPPGSTQYIGLAWCAGTMTAIDGVITCSGASMDNKSQTDSAVANVTFRVEQSRNNEAFVCGTPSTEPEPIVWTTDGTRTGGSATVSATTTESGSNALVLITIDDVDSRVRYNYDVADIDLSAFTGFSYDSKQVSAFDPINGNASFRLVVDLDGDLLTVGDVKDVTYEPYYNIQAHNPLNDASITTGVWQNWAATMADGRFWAGGVTTILGPSEGAGGAYATNFTIAQLLAAYPSAKIIGISIGMGTYNKDQVVVVDNLIFNGNVLGFE